MSCGIYKITNQVNGKVYIGQSKKIENRWEEHRQTSIDLKRNEYNYPLYQAFRKYGLENFTFEVIEECLPKELNQKEIDYISLYESYPPDNGKGYNQNPGGQGGKLLKLSGDELSKLLYDLKETSIPIKELAQIYNISIYSIYDLNQGKYYIDENFQYPIREFKKHPKKYCIKCGRQISHNANICKSCRSIIAREKQIQLKIESQVKIKDKSSKCPICGREMANIADKLCINCFRKEGVEWDSPFKTKNSLIKIPFKEQLLKSFYELQNCQEVANKYNISTVLLNKWRDQLNIPRKREDYIKLYEEEYLGVINKNIKYKRSKVAQISLETNEILNIFDNCNQAAKHLGFEKNEETSTYKGADLIRECCLCKVKKAYNYFWKFYEEDKL